MSRVDRRSPRPVPPGKTAGSAKTRATADGAPIHDAPTSQPSPDRSWENGRPERFGTSEPSRSVGGAKIVAEAQRRAGIGKDAIAVRMKDELPIAEGESVTGILRRKLNGDRLDLSIELADGKSLRLDAKQALGVPNGGRLTLRRDGKVRLDPENSDHVRSFVGRVELVSGKPHAVSTDPLAPFPRLPLSELAGARPGDQVLVHVEAGLSDRRSGLVEQVIPKDAAWPATFTKLAVEMGVEATFGPKVRADVERLVASFDPASIPGYKDLSEKPFFSIDNPYSKDFDQAMHIEPTPGQPGKLDVLYAVADLDFFMKLAGEGSALAERAHRIQTTTYLPEMDFPILPRELSEGICSLNEGERRPAFVVKFTVSPDGKVEAPEFLDAVIVNRKNGNYGEAQAHLDGQRVKDPAYAGGIDRLGEVGRRLLGDAERRGMFTASEGEAWAKLDPRTGGISLEHRGEKWVEAANAQVSIAANRLVGRFLLDNAAPAFHRRHEEPDAAKQDGARRVLSKLGITWAPGEEPSAVLARIDSSTTKGRAAKRAVQRTLPRAHVSAEPGAHHGLRVEEYVQSTAPMRRARDARNHAFVRAVRDGKTPDRSRLPDEIARAQEAEDRSRRLDWEVRARIATAALAEHVGKPLEAEVLGVSPWGVNLRFPSVGVELGVPFRTLGLGRFELGEDGTVAKSNGVEFRLGQKVQAKLLEADPHAARARFEFPGAAAVRSPGKTGKARSASGPVRALSEVRGDGFESPLVGQRVRTRGVVTAAHKAGFFLVPEGAAPGAVTGGIQVRTKAHVRPGDVVEVDGQVHERKKADAPYDRSVVELVEAKAQVVGKTEPPPALALTETVPADRKEAVEFWRQRLGQRVKVGPATALAPSNPFGDLVVLPQGWEPAGATRTARGGVLMPDGEFNHQHVGLKLPRGAAASVAVGDQVNGTEGVVIYRSGGFQVELSEAPSVTKAPTSPAPVSPLAPEPGKMVVANVNALNLHPGETKRAAALADRIVNGLLSPDVIALQEIQDNDGPAATGTTAADKTYGMLIDKIQQAGGPRYAWFDIPPQNGQDGGQPGGNIRNGFLYREDRVKLDEESVARIGEGNPAFDGTRKSLAAVFEMEGRRLLVVNNHLSSRRGSSPWTADVEVPVVGKAEARQAQAEAVRAFVDAARTKESGLDAVMIGDMNDGHRSPAVERLTRGGFDDITLKVPPADRFDYNYRGTLQTLQPVVGSPGLAQRTEAAFLHNSVYEGVKDSDHDPVVVRIDMRS